MEEGLQSDKGIEEGEETKGSLSSADERQGTDDNNETKKNKDGVRKSTLLAMSSFQSDAVKDYQKIHRKRRKIIGEILSTERTYSQSLVFICEEYRYPMLLFCKETKALSEGVVQKLFSNIDIITELHCMLLEQLEERIREWSPEHTKIGDIFLKLAPFMRLYTEYVNSYDNAVRVLGSLATNKKVLTFLRGRKTPSPTIKGDWYLSNLLILPVQRIPRYMLFFKELVKETEEVHVDYEDLCKCEGTIAGLAAQIDEAKRLFENCQKLWAIQNRLTFEETDLNHHTVGTVRKSAKLKGSGTYHTKRVLLVKPARRLVREGEVWVAEKNEELHCMLFLFSDCLLLTKILHGEELRYITMFNLFGASVKSHGTSDVNSTTASPSKFSGKRTTRKYGNHVITLGCHLTISSYWGGITFYTDRPEELPFWEADITRQIDKAASRMTFNEILLLHEACKSGKEAAVRKYASLGDLEKPDYKGRTPLYMAVKKGHTAIVKVLLEEYKADPNARNKAGTSCIDAATIRGYDEIVDLLKKHLSPASQQKKGEDARPNVTVRAGLAGHLDIAELEQIIMKMGKTAQRRPPPDGKGSRIAPPPLPTQGWAAVGSPSSKDMHRSDSSITTLIRTRKATLFSKSPRMNSGRKIAPKQEIQPLFLKELERMNESKKKQEDKNEKAAEKQKKKLEKQKKNEDKKKKKEELKSKHNKGAT